MVKEQMEDVFKEIQCGNQMHLLTYSDSLRLLYRVLNEMIADTLTFGNIVHKAGTAVKRVAKKSVARISSGLGRLRRFFQRKKDDQETVDLSQMPDADIVEALQAGTLTIEADKPKKDASPDSAVSEAIDSALNDVPQQPPEEVEEENSDGEVVKVSKREVLLTKTIFRLMVFLTNLLFPDADPVDDLSSIKIPSKEDRGNKAYREMLSRVVNLYDEVRDDMGKATTGARSKSKNFQDLVSQIEELQANADKKSVRVNCPTVGMIINTFQERFEHNNKKDELLVKGVEGVFKIATVGLKIGAALGAMAVGSQGGPQAGALAGEIANGVIDVVWGSLQKLLLSPFKQTAAIKAFRRQIRIVLLGGLQGIILAHSTTVEAQKKDQNEPDVTDCYQAVLHVFRMILMMLDTGNDKAITAARSKCVEDDLRVLFKKDKMHNLRNLKFFNFPERFKPILTFLGSRTEMADIQKQIKFVDGAVDMGAIVKQGLDKSMKEVVDYYQEGMKDYFMDLKLKGCTGGAGFLETNAITTSE